MLVPDVPLEGFFPPLLIGPLQLLEVRLVINETYLRSTIKQESVSHLTLTKY